MLKHTKGTLNGACIHAVTELHHERLNTKASHVWDTIIDSAITQLDVARVTEQTLAGKRALLGAILKLTDEQASLFRFWSAQTPAITKDDKQARLEAAGQAYRVVKQVLDKWIGIYLR